jgi:hypothetical protein
MHVRRKEARKGGSEKANGRKGEDRFSPKCTSDAVRHPHTHLNNPNK